MSSVQLLAHRLASFEQEQRMVFGATTLREFVQMLGEADVPLRSHGSRTLNRSLLSAGLVDRLQLTVFPVLSGRSDTVLMFAGPDDFGLDLLESRTLDGRSQELVYRPTPHGRS